MIDEATGYKLCKRGHVMSPDNISGRSNCRICKNIRRRVGPRNLIDEVTGYKICSRGHIRSPDNVNKYNACITCTQLQKGVVNPRKIDKETGYKLCSRGHVKSPENRYGRTCKTCADIRSKAQKQTPEYKEWEFKYRRSWHCRNKDKIRRNSTKYKEQLKKHKATSEYIEKDKIWRSTIEFKIRSREAAKRFSLTDKGVEAKLRHRATNRYKETCKRKQVQTIQGISDNYIATTMRIPISDIPPQLLEFKRMHIKLKREIKNASSIN